MSTSATTQVNSATGLLGSTGSGKTSLLATAAEYLADTFPGQVLALYSADGGGYPTKVQSLIKVGVIRVWRMRTRGEAFESCVLASRGWWPSRIDARTGETEPFVRMVPPITEQYTMGCPNGHVVKAVPLPSLLTPGVCPTCKVMVTKETMTITKTSARTRGFEQIGAVAFDGLTSFLSWMMDDMASRHARQELKGEDSALGGRIVSGSLSLGGNNRSHFGFVQGRAENMVLSSSGIPGLSLPPFWTGLLLETTDEGGLAVKGMKLVGKAKTDEAGAWFGNMAEVAIVRNEAGQEVRRLYLGEYIDDAGVRHLLKHRGSPKLPAYLQDEPGQPWGQVNLGLFFDLLSKDIEDSAKAAEAKYGTVAGGMMSYGEPAAPDAPATTPVQATAVASPTPVAQGTTPVLRAPKPKARPAAVAPAIPPPAVVASPSSESPTTGTTQPSTAVPPPVGDAPPAVSGTSSTSLAPQAPATPAPSIARPAGIAPPPGPRPPAVAPRRPPTAAPRPTATARISAPTPGSSSSSSS